MGISARMRLLALALVCVVACVSGVEDTDVESVPLPMHDKNFMDYVVSLVDEFAPDIPTAAEEKEEAAQSAVKHDEKRSAEAKRAVAEAKQAADLAKQKAKHARETAKLSEKKSEEKEKTLQTEEEKAHADNIQTDKDKDAEAAAHAKVE